MGCWNGTCGISQMAIRSGEPTIGFLMVRNPGDKWSANGHCYPTAYWCPLSLHIEGTYNDYGAIDNVDENDWNVEVAHKYIVENMIEQDVGENKYHDIAVKKDDIGWKNLSEAMHEDRIELSIGTMYKQFYPNTTELQVGLMMVHRKVFDAIIKQGIDYWGGSITMDSLMKDGKDIVAYFRENDKTIKGAITESEKALVEILMDHGMDMVHIKIGKDNHLSQITISNEGANFNVGKEYLRYLSERIYAGDTDEQLDVIIKKLAEFYIFQSAMSMMRKTWMPQAGAGGQTDESELYTAVNQAVDGIITERASERAAWENEDE